MAKQSRNYRLSPRALELIKELSEQLGLSQAGVIEMAVRKLAEREQVS